MHFHVALSPVTFKWIGDHSNAILQRMEKPNRRSVDAAWRQAAETWLRYRGLITAPLTKKRYSICALS